MHVESKLHAHRFDVLKALLVVGAGATDPDLNVVVVQGGRDFAQGPNDTLEGRCDVCKVSNAATDEEHLAIGVCGRAQHQIQDGTGIVVGLSLSGSTRVFTIVGKFADKASRCDGVGVDDRRTTTSYKGPDTTAGVEDSELERCTSLGIHVGDEFLLLAQLAAKGSGELHRRTGVNVDRTISFGERSQTQSCRTTGNSPLAATFKLGSLVELSSQVEEMDFGRGAFSVRDNDKRVDFKIGKLAIDVDGVEAGDEVHEDIVDTLGDVFQESRGNLLVGGVILQVNGDKELLSFGVDITDVDTTLVGEENPIALNSLAFSFFLLSRDQCTYLAHGVDVDIVFGVLGMGDEGLDEELTKDTGDSLNLDGLCGASLDPFTSLGPGFVESQETALTSSLDQLVWFGDELGARGQQPGIGDLSLVQDILDSSVFGEVDGGESGRRIMGGRWREGSRLDDGSTSEMIVEDRLPVGLEDGFGRHDVA